MSDYTGVCLKGVYGVAQPSLKALVSSRCRLLCIKLDYDFYLRKRIPTFKLKSRYHAETVAVKDFSACFLMYFVRETAVGDLLCFTCDFASLSR